MLFGIGEVPSILLFFNNCGFTRSPLIENYFTGSFDHPMFEEGIQLIDMISLKNEL